MKYLILISLLLTLNLNAFVTVTVPDPIPAQTVGSVSGTNTALNEGSAISDCNAHLTQVTQYGEVIDSFPNATVDYCYSGLTGIFEQNNHHEWYEPNWDCNATSNGAVHPHIRWSYSGTYNIHPYYKECKYNPTPCESGLEYQDIDGTWQCTLIPTSSSSTSSSSSSTSNNTCNDSAPLLSSLVGTYSTAVQCTNASQVLASTLVDITGSSDPSKKCTALECLCPNQTTGLTYLYCHDSATYQRCSNDLVYVNGQCIDSPCGVNEELYNGSCRCIDNFFLSGKTGNCETPDNYCLNHTRNSIPNVFQNEIYCSCPIGYTFEGLANDRYCTPPDCDIDTLFNDYQRRCEGFGTVLIDFNVDVNCDVTYECGESSSSESSSSSSPSEPEIGEPCPYTINMLWNGEDCECADGYFTTASDTYCSLFPSPDLLADFNLTKEEYAELLDSNKYVENPNSTVIQNITQSNNELDELNSNVNKSNKLLHDMNFTLSSMDSNNKKGLSDLKNSIDGAKDVLKGMASNVKTTAENTAKTANNTAQTADNTKGILDAINSDFNGFAQKEGMPNLDEENSFLDNFEDNFDTIKSDVTSIKDDYDSLLSLVNGDVPTPVLSGGGSCSMSFSLMGKTYQPLERLPSILSPYSSIFALLTYIMMMIANFRFLFLYFALGRT